MNKKVLICGDGGKIKEFARLMAKCNSSVIIPIEKHDADLLNKVAERIDKALTDEDSVYKEISSEWDKGTFMGCVLAVIEDMKAEIAK